MSWKPGGGWRARGKERGEVGVGPSYSPFEGAHRARAMSTGEPALKVMGALLKDGLRDLAHIGAAAKC